MKFLHTADTHIGYTQYHKKERENDFLEAFSEIVTKAIEEDVEAVIHGGDLFHSSQPGFNSLVGVLEQLNRLNENGIEFLSVLGNHDGGRGAKWVDVFEQVERARHLGKEPHVIGDVAFYGIDYMSEGKRDYYSYQFGESESKYNILVSHGGFSELTFGDWKLEDIITESNIDFESVLLGDEHEFIMDEHYGIPITYSGSTERTAIDQKEKRGYNIIRVDGSIQINHKKFSTRNFEYVSIDIDEGTTFNDVKQAFNNKQISDSVIEVTITGHSNTIPISKIEEYLTENGALHVKVNNKIEQDNGIDVINVNFVDPEQEIIDEVEKREFSQSAIELEEDVRDKTISKSNMKDRSEDFVERLIDEKPEKMVRPNSDIQLSSNENAETRNEGNLTVGDSK